MLRTKVEIVYVKRVGELLRQSLHLEDAGELIRLFHTCDPGVDDHLKGLCAQELLDRGFNW